MVKFNKKSQSQPVGRQDLSAQNISARIGMGAGGTPIGEPSAIAGNPLFQSQIFGEDCRNSLCHSSTV